MPIIMSIVVIAVMIISAIDSNQKKKPSSSGSAGTQRSGNPESLSGLLSEVVNEIKTGRNKDSGQPSGSGHQNHNPAPPSASYRRTSAPQRATQNSDMGTGRYDLSRRDDMGTSVYPGERDIPNTARTMIFTIILSVLLILYFLV